MYDVNWSLCKDIITNLPETKRTVLDKALDRNFSYTSVANLEDITLLVYKQGYELFCQGCKTHFSVYVNDNDGELEYTRKPRKLDWLYTDTGKVSEDFYTRKRGN